MMMMMLGFCMIVCVMGPYGFYIFWPCGLDQFHDRSSPHAMTAMESCHSLYIAYVASRSTLAMRHRYPKNSEDQILVYEFTDRCLWEAQRARQNSGWTAKMKKHNFTTNFKAFFFNPTLRRVHLKLQGWILKKGRNHWLKQASWNHTS
jgi:hypothetical protein